MVQRLQEKKHQKKVLEQLDLQEEIDRVAAACKARGLPLDRVFFSSPSAGTLATFFDDDYFHDHQKYVAALGAAMKTE